MRHILTYISLILLAISCGETPDVQEAKLLLSVNDTSVVQGGILEFDASESTLDKVIWRLDEVDIETCHRSLTCSIKFDDIGEYTISVKAFLKDDSAGGGGISAPGQQSGNSGKSTDVASITITVIPKVLEEAVEEVAEVLNRGLPKPVEPEAPDEITLPEGEQNITLTEDRHGEAEKAYAFNGTDSYMRGTLDQQLGGTLTLSAWFKTPGSGEKNPRLVEVAGESGEFLTSSGLAITTTGILWAWATCEQPSQKVGMISHVADSYDDGYWHYAAYVYNGGTSAKLYVDGALVATTTNALCTNLQDMKTFSIGSYYPDTDNTFNGDIDLPRIYTVALSANQIANIHKEETPYAPEADPVSPDVPEALEMTVVHQTPVRTPDQQGTSNQAYFFNGINDQVRGTVNEDIANKVSLSGWFKTGGGIVGSRIIEVSDQTGTSTYSTAIAYLTDGSLSSWTTCKETNTRVGVVQSEGVNVNDSQWHHVVYVYDGSKGHLYIDGNLLTSSDEESCDNLFGIKTFAIGSHYIDSFTTFFGEIAHAKVYHGALTAEDIAGIYTAEQ